MGSGGLEWDANDNPEQARLNQKTTFVGTTAQRNGLSTTYVGQFAYDTDDDVMYVRDSTNTTWNTLKAISDTITETSEDFTSYVSATNYGALSAGHRWYFFQTLPTTHPLYIITGIEWLNGPTVSGNVMCGVDAVDADPPTIDNTPLIAVGMETAQSGTYSYQRNSNIASNLIRGGTTIGIWISPDNGTGEFGYKASYTAGQNQSKGTAYSAEPSASENTTWTSQTSALYTKAYYRAYY